MGSCVTYAYQFPFKKYVAEKKFFKLLHKEYGLTPDDIQNVIKDVKSARGGVWIRFTVSGSLYEYSYDYSVQKNDWLRGYVEDGVYYSTNKIIFEEE